VDEGGCGESLMANGERLMAIGERRVAIGERLLRIMMNNNGNRFRQLNVYQSAKTLVKDVYTLLKQFPKEEQYALCDQLRRAVISVPSNIAEGMGRASDKDQAHFIEMAYGSLLEVQCQLEISAELGYITLEEFEIQDKQIETIGKMLSGLRSLRKDLPASRL